MDYKGRYQIFDPAGIRTYPILSRTNKVGRKDLLGAENIKTMEFDLPGQTHETIEFLAQQVVRLRRAGKPVILFTGAHLIKNGLGPLLVDLVRKELVTLVAGNGATGIHDFELALIGETSEYVPQALEKGQFGMAYEFCYLNVALQVGHQYRLGYGESLGKMICDASFRREVLEIAAEKNSPREFSCPQFSVLAACYEKHIPFTIHAGIGTDVIDQHPSFDGSAKGGCSGRDFLIYTKEVTGLSNGGMVLNIGSAVTGPEVFLKAASMAGNTGHVPRGIITADFDIRHYESSQMTDESAQGYYFRDQKSVVTRIPQAYDGRGCYVQGNQKQTFPWLYKKIIDNLDNA